MTLSGGGARLAWSEAGDPGGPAVVYFHGTPKTEEPFAYTEVADEVGVRVLMVDRPGYGSSPPRAGASFTDVARMVLDDLAGMGVREFAVLGWSGGGPHALACAADSPSRVRSVGLFGSWAPMDPPDRGLPLGVRFAMRVAANLPRPAVQLMLLGRSAGMADDVRRVARPWGFDVERVAASVRVVAWHAEHDPQVPVAPWRAVKGIELNVLPGDAHDVSRDLWKVALRSVAGDGAPGSPR